MIQIDQLSENQALIIEQFLQFYSNQLLQLSLVTQEQIDQKVTQLIQKTNKFEERYQVYEDKQIIIGYLDEILLVFKKIPKIYTQFFEICIFDLIPVETIKTQNLAKEKLLEVLSDKIKHSLRLKHPKIDNWPWFDTYLKIYHKSFQSLVNHFREEVINFIDDFKKTNENIGFANKFLLITLLKELARNLDREIIQQVDTTFLKDQKLKVKQMYSSFIIQTHEYIVSGYKPCQDNCEELENFTIKEVNYLQQLIEEVSLELGVRITFQSQSSKKSNSTAKNHQIYKKIVDSGDQTFLSLAQHPDFDTVASKPVENYIQQLDPVSNLSKTIKTHTMQQPILIAGTLSDIGSSLGQCLANINNYKSAASFLKDFGYRSTLNGSITFLIQKLPILGQLLLLGGLGYNTIQLFNDKVANTSQKINYLGKLAVGTTSAIGGSVSGAIIGQSIIVIPLVGAFIGGLIGGIFGASSGTWLVQKINQSRVYKIAHGLQKYQEKDGSFWYS